MNTKFERKMEKKIFANREDKFEFEMLWSKKILFSFMLSWKEKKSIKEDDSLISGEIRTKKGDSINSRIMNDINENYNLFSQNLKRIIV